MADITFSVSVRQLAFIIVMSGLFTFYSHADNLPPPDFNSPSFDCRNKVNGTDYRYATNKVKSTVEGAHFTAGVQRGEYGNAGSLEGDLDYVLKYFPNHPKALLIAAKNQMKSGYSPRHPLRRDMFWPKKECYFQYALRFAEDDPSVHLVIAIFYHQFGNTKVAAHHYKRAITLNPNNSEAHYNYGLLLVDISQPERALEHAKTAYAMGYPLAGLKNRLKRENVWKDG